MYTLWLISGLRVLFVFKRRPSQTLRFSSSVCFVYRRNRRAVLFHDSFLSSILVSWVVCSVDISYLWTSFFFVFKNFLRPLNYLKQRLYMCKYSVILSLWDIIALQNLWRLIEMAVSWCAVYCLLLWDCKTWFACQSKQAQYTVNNPCSKSRCPALISYSFRRNMC